MLVKQEIGSRGSWTISFLSFRWLFIAATPLLHFSWLKTDFPWLSNLKLKYFVENLWGSFLFFLLFSVSALLNLRLALFLGMDHFPVATACLNTSACSTSPFVKAQTKTWHFVCDWFLLRCEQLPRAVSQWRDLQGKFMSNLETLWLSETQRSLFTLYIF